MAGAMLAIVALLSGCLTVPESYFHAEALGFESSGGFCGGAVGPPQHISRKNDAGRYNISVRRDSVDNGYVSVTILLSPIGGSAWIVNMDKFAVYGQQSNDVIPIEAISLIDYWPYADKDQAHLQIQPVIAYTSRELGLVDSSLLVQAKIQIGERSVFHVVVPTIENSNAPSLPRVVSFTKKSGAFTYPINC